MKNKNKIIFLTIILAMVAIPYWRINHNSKFFVEGLMGHLSHLGDWTHQGVSTSLNGNITVSGIIFKPKGNKQSISIRTIDVQTDIKKLLFSNTQDLTTHVPNNMTMSMKDARFINNGSDVKEAAVASGFWPMTVGYLGAFGCGTGPGPSFTMAQWDQISALPEFNVEVSYSLIDSYHLDFSLNLHAIDNWYIVWSGTLTRASDSSRITFNDTIIETLYYYHVDQGFNKKRNDFCADENNTSFAAYRLKSAEEIQQHLRVYAEKEMPQFLNNQYQRSLAENIEMNAIFKLNEPMYIYEFAALSQNEFLSQSGIEAAIGENDYQAIELADIDYLELDMETLRAEMEAKEQEAARKEAEANKPKELLKTVTYTIGGVNKNETLVSDWSKAIGKNIKVRTKRGRPIFGKLLSINDKHITISSRYMRGNATLTVKKKDIQAMTLSR